MKDFSTTNTLFLFSKVNILLLLITVNSYSGFSQGNYQPGYIITNNGDSIVGQINWSITNSSYEQCTFQDTLDYKKSIIYKPNDIKEYGFLNGLRFKSYNLDSSTVFLRVIIQGRLSMYSHKGSFYVKKEESTLIRLENSQTLWGVLHYLVSDYPQQGKLKLMKVKLNIKSLHNLATTYNEYFEGESKSFLYNSKLLDIETMVIGGINSSSLQIESKVDDYQILTNKFKPSVNYVLGLGLNINSPYLSPSFSIILFPYWFKSQYSLVHQTSNSFEQRWDDAQIILNHFKIPIGIEWKYGGFKNKIKIGSGVSDTRNMVSANEWITYSQINSTISKNSTEVFPIKKNQYGYWFSIGYRKKMFKNINTDLTFIYESTNGLSTFDYLNKSSDRLNTSIKNLSCLLSISF